MIYMLDTDICIYIIKKKPAEVARKFESMKIGDVCISSITVSELFFGACKSQHKKQNIDALNEFILPLEIVNYDDNAAFCYGDVRAALESLGTPIGSMDLMIAAHAKSINAMLVTNNMKEFKRVEGLKVQNWVGFGKKKK